MANAVRDAFVERLNCARRELRTAGPIHRKDLTRCIKRMERELFDYDRFHKGGDSNGKRAKPSPTEYTNKE